MLLVILHLLLQHAVFCTPPTGLDVAASPTSLPARWGELLPRCLLSSLDKCSRFKMYEVESCFYARSRQVESKDNEKVLKLSLYSFLS